MQTEHIKHEILSYSEIKQILTDIKTQDELAYSDLDNDLDKDTELGNSDFNHDLKYNDFVELDFN